ncbi:hybrid sensor histidine kinase/response regulator [Desulfobotulus sp.]|jgi:signal transduction histidine kinase|uniref:hybrid sensor histidine kinase/response regulator n=1 Tax=Desulfobotulus sp. TaxID=1940337 RepID=UPI002A361310|nr:hybrid sensor histidine kinase/response regulator [Desulfobotulus sp.]MDY0162771.1 hybrid sensor histidine kinase/response regulator [Desulfobotulus sp.]
MPNTGRRYHDISLVLVDDEAAFRDTLAKRLEKREIKVHPVACAKQALEILAREPVDVVISDVRMPEMSGHELLARILENHPDKEVILLTGHGDLRDGVEGIRAGAFDYITKPVEIDHIESKVRQAAAAVRRRKERQVEGELRKQLEERALQAEKLATVGTLATGVAHEINNPLAIINEAAGWIGQVMARPSMRDLPENASLTRASEIIQTAVDRARRITHQLLGMVRKESEAPTICDMPGYLMELASLCRSIHPENEVAIHVEEDTPFTLITDPHKLRQILVNLVENAIQATPKGGCVTLSSQLTDTGKVTIQVQDTGPGIPESVKKRIFDPFFTTKPQGKGTGLGLYLCRDLSHHLGGELEVSSRPGEGACFTLTLPRALPNGTPP